MKPYYQDEWVEQYCSDALTVLRGLEGDSVDLLATDPPYGIGFMGKDWDKALPDIDIWRECLRVLKAGSFAFVMSIPRADCLSRMIISLEDVGFLVNFTPIFWAYASGFPKAQNIGKAVDKRGGISVSWFGEWLRKWRAENNITQKEVAKLFPSKTGGLTGCVANWELGLNLPTPREFTTICRHFNLPFESIEEAEREVIGTSPHGFGPNNGASLTHTLKAHPDITISSTPQAKALDGSYGGFQPKPALECILCAQKPLTLEAECSIITSQALELLEVIIQCTDVNSVGRNTLGDMASIVQGRVTVKSIEEAKAQIGKVGGQYELMAMLESILARMEKDIALTHWNTGLLWKSILVDLLSQMSKFTTSMVTELIIELKTLNSLIFASIQENTTTPEKTHQSGLRLNVGIVESILASVLIKLLSLNHTIAPINATLNICTGNQAISVKDAGKDSLQTTQSGNTARSNAIGSIDTRVIIVAMKPLSEKTFVDQALKNQKSITWLDDCRIPYESEHDIKYGRPASSPHAHNGFEGKSFKIRDRSMESPIDNQDNRGRFPANLLVSDDVLNDGRERLGKWGVSKKRNDDSIFFDDGNRSERCNKFIGDSGSFSRYFDLDKWWAKTFPFLIVPKASKSEKNKGIGVGVPRTEHGSTPRQNETGNKSPNNHPTVKPLKLMSYLITLGSRQGDVVLDPFSGSGTTMLASKLLCRKCIGIEIKEKYCGIATRRCSQGVLDLSEVK